MKKVENKNENGNENENESESRFDLISTHLIRSDEKLDEDVKY